MDESGASMVLPPALRDRYDRGGNLRDGIDKTADATEHQYIALGNFLMARGLTNKQAREAARAVLPNMTETRIVVTGNLRAWHEVVERRTAPDADAEMREVMGMIRDELNAVAPTIFPKETD